MMMKAHGEVARIVIMLILTWLLWAQDIVNTERSWIPNNWPWHWTTAELAPRLIDEYKTLAACRDARHEMIIQEAAETTESLKQQRRLRAVTHYARVPVEQKPRRISIDGSWD